MSECNIENQIIRGSSKTYVFSLEDEDGTTVTDLASATEVEFFLKKNASDTTNVVELSLTANPTQIFVNDPTTGDVKVLLFPADTTIDARGYVGVLKITYSAERVEFPSFFSSDGSDIDSFIVVYPGT